LRSRRFIWVLVPLVAAPPALAGCTASFVEPTGGSGTTSDVSSVSSAGTGGASGTTSTGTSGGFGGGVTGNVAHACTNDADCSGGLSCLTDAASDPIFGGGPAGGFCTKACNQDLDCAPAGAVCYKVDPAQPGRCTLPCTFGPPITSVDDLFASLSMDKCFGREDLRCAKAGGAGVCLPTCGSDSQCSGGRVCDPRLAVCVDKANEGDPIGTMCDPTMTDTTCAGVCIGFDSGVTMCSRPCVLGGVVTDTDDCGGLDQGLCAFRPKANGPGDAGYCTPSCTAAEDCQNPSFWCFTVPMISAQNQKGYCFAATPCPGGQNDCIAANGANYTCTSTAYGPYCLDPAFLPAMPP
jgi:hypothetical protein